jgi:5-methylcytosine-specific restriction endonuclease McrA
VKRRKDRGADTALYERDHWWCQMPVCYCPDGREIDPALRDCNDPWAPSLDHVVPRRMGGPDLPRNLRAAHRLCNNRNADRLSGILSRDGQ